MGALNRVYVDIFRCCTQWRIKVFCLVFIISLSLYSLTHNDNFQLKLSLGAKYNSMLTSYCIIFNLLIFFLQKEGILATETSHDIFFTVFLWYQQCKMSEIKSFEVILFLFLLRQYFCIYVFTSWTTFVYKKNLMLDIIFFLFFIDSLWLQK